MTREAIRASFSPWKIVVAVLVTMAVFGVGIGMAVYESSARPETGDCLGDLIEDSPSWDVIPCDDPVAAYRIVETTGGGNELRNSVCEGWPDGQVVWSDDSDSEWRMCVVALD